MIEECNYERPTTREQISSLRGVLYFTWEREVIRIVKERGGETPYTKDPVLRDYKFTNIRRRDDRVTRWVLTNMIQPDEHRRDLWFQLLIARLINWPVTLRHLIYERVLPVAPADFIPERFSAVIEELRPKVDKIYSGAYMVYPTKKDPAGRKSLAVARHIIAPAARLNDAIIQELDYERPKIENIINIMTASFGVSTFMAGQVAADLTYSPKHLGPAEDLYTYAPIGPGSSKGLNYALGRGLTSSWKPEEFNRELIKIREAIVNELDIDDLTLHDVQNIMCEYSKYARTVLGEGVPKTRYKPETEF